MKRLTLTLAFCFFWMPEAEACVGRILNVGVVNSAEGQVMAELLTVMINERTGTTVTVRYYDDAKELYNAVKIKQVDITIENTARALQLLNMPAESDAKKAYDTVKAAYEKEKGVVWLKPFGYMNSGGGAQSHTAPVLRVEVFSDFPALPRVIEKLGGLINDETHERLIKAVESGEKPKKAARDFLKSKKLI